MKRKWNKEPQSSLERECVEYFREHPVFDRVLKGFRRKYVSYGDFAGKVTLQNVTGRDLEDLEGFFQRNYHGQKAISISALQFEKALGDSRFNTVLPKTILEAYFQEEMLGKQAQKTVEEDRWKKTFAKMAAHFEGTPAAKWLEEVWTAKTGAWPYLTKRYKEAGKDMETVRRMLLLGGKIVNGFPARQGAVEYLAVFAAMLTGNPHALDDGTVEGKLLYLLVQRAAAEQNEIGKSSVFPALQKQRLYLKAGILRDDISNYAMFSGIRAWKKTGEPHLGMEGFWREGDMVQVPLSVLAGFARVSCPGDAIYIVENPSIYAMLCGEWRGKRACMCMNGQPRLCSVLLLDLLAAAGVHLYYGGDFDPEGLLIAQKVKQYYKGTFTYWHMSAAEYSKSRSGEQISERRLKMLERITDTELKDTADAVRKSRMAGYQENIWEVFPCAETKPTT